MEQDETWGFQPVRDLLARILHWSRRPVNLGMSDNRVKLIKARPGNRPVRSSFRELGDDLIGGAVPFRIFAMRVDQDVSVDCNHALAQSIN